GRVLKLNIVQVREFGGRRSYEATINGEFGGRRSSEAIINGVQGLRQLLEQTCSRSKSQQALKPEFNQFSFCFNIVYYAHIDIHIRAKAKPAQAVFNVVTYEIGILFAYGLEEKIAVTYHELNAITRGSLAVELGTKAYGLLLILTWATLWLVLKHPGGANIFLTR
ncbi:hypothetical protein GIB67_040446, partial [Kingdonia uniflora]